MRVKSVKRWFLAIWVLLSSSTLFAQTIVEQNTTYEFFAGTFPTQVGRSNGDVWSSRVAGAHYAFFDYLVKGISENPYNIENISGFKNFEVLGNQGIINIAIRESGVTKIGIFQQRLNTFAASNDLFIYDLFTDITPLSLPNGVSLNTERPERNSTTFGDDNGNLIINWDEYSGEEQVINLVTMKRRLFNTINEELEPSSPITWRVRFVKVNSINHLSLGGPGSIIWTEHPLFYDDICKDYSNEEFFILARGYSPRKFMTVTESMGSSFSISSLHNEKIRFSSSEYNTWWKTRTTRPSQVQFKFSINLDSEESGFANVFGAFNVTINTNHLPKELSDLPPVENVPSNIVLCSDDDLVSLPTGCIVNFGCLVSFTGTGVINNFGNFSFDPKAVSPGTYTITKRRNYQGCYKTANFTITVKPPVEDSFTFTIPTENAVMCKDEAQVDLQGYTNQTSNLTFSWEGGSGRYFSPSQNTAGTKTITATYTDSDGCVGTQTGTIEVRNLPTITLSNSLTVCVGDVTDISVTPNTGTWSVVSGSTPITAAGQIAPTETGNNVYRYTVTANGCTSTKDITVTVVGLPTKPSANGVTSCTTGTFTLTATGLPTGGSVRWYDAAEGGNLLGSNASYTTPNLTASCSYWVEAVSNSGCISQERRKVDVVIFDATALGTPTVQDQTVCKPTASNVNVEIRATGAPSGHTYLWFSNSDNYNEYKNNPLSEYLLYQGGIFNQSISQTTTYYVAFRSPDGCVGNLNSVTVTVVPNNVSAHTAASVQVCKGSNVTLSPNPTGGSWSGNGSSFMNGNVFVTNGSTPVSSYTLTYTYTNPTNNCTFSKDVTVQVLDRPLTPIVADKSRCGIGSINFTVSNNTYASQYEWFDSDGTSLGTSNSLSIVLQNGEVKTLYVEGILGNCRSERGSFTATSIQGDQIPWPTVTAAEGQMVSNELLGCVNTLGGSTNFFLTASGGDLGDTYAWYSSQTATSPLAVGESYTFSAQQFTSAIFVALRKPDGCESSRRRVGVDVDLTPSAPVSSMGNNSTTVYLCGESSNTATFGVSAPPTVSESRIRWFNSPNSQTILSTGSQYTTPALSANASYYVEYISDNGRCVSPRTRFDVVFSSNVTANAGADMTICRNDSDFTLTGASPSGGEWFGNAVAANGLVDVSALSPGDNTINYRYRDAVSGCFAMDMKIITVIDPDNLSLPEISDVSICGPGQVTLVATGAPVGGGFRWYSVPEGGSVLRNTPDYTVTVNATVSYYVSAVTAGGCESGRKQVTVTVNTLPDALTPVDGSRCGPGQVSLGVADVTSGNTVVWYNSLTSTSPLYQGETYAPTVTAARSYYASQRDGNSCESERVEVRAVINALPTINPGADLTVCKSQNPFTISGAVPSGGTWSSPVAGLVENNTFNPTAASLGANVITYTYTDPVTGCTNTANRTMNVIDLESLTIGEDFEVCVNSARYNLMGDVNNTSGSWSGNGVSGTQFDASISGVGTFLLTYTVNLGPCSVQATRSVTVLPVPTVDAGNTVNACLSSPVQLVGSPANGTWSGNYITPTGEFMSSSIGDYQVTYTVLGANGCTASDNVTVRVNGRPIVEAGNSLSVCEGSGTIALTGYSPTGGNWSGTGIVGGSAQFDASGLTAGDYTLTYTYTDPNTGCTNSDTRNVKINTPVPHPAFSALELCSNSSVYSLGVDVDPSYGNGTWLGLGVVSGNTFNPAQVPIANYGTPFQIEYRRTDANGCQVRTYRSVTVNGIPTADAGTDVTVCLNQGQVALTANGSNDGVWSGNGIIEGTNLFDPSVSGIGQFTISYTRTNAQNCSFTDTKIVRVNALPSVSAGANVYVCNGVASIELGNGNPNGGYWSDPNGFVNGTLFDVAMAGTGSHDVTYTYQDQFGCSVSSTKKVIVQATAPVFAGDDLQVCTNGNVIDLSTRGNEPKGGTFTGQGLTGTNGNILNPQSLSPGSYTITYTYSDASLGCSGSDTFVLTVNALPSVAIGGNLSLCLTQAPYDLMASANPQGGTFTGPGVTDGRYIDPSQAGIGQHVVYYEYTSANGCTVTAQRNITIKEVAQVDAGENIFTCISGNIIDLDADASASGTWSGSAGITASNFSPSQAGLGVHVVTLTVTNANGCQSTDTRTITVQPDLTVSGGNDIQACLGGGNIDLMQNVSLPNGVWSGQNVVNGRSFQPTAIGTYSLTYTVTNAAGCTASDNVLVTVNALPSVSVGSTASLCVTAPAYSLTGIGFPSGGTWSGPTVTNNTFIPSLAGVGSHELIYSYTSANGCTVDKVKVINVTQPTLVEAGPNVTVCINSGSVNLDNGAEKSGGQWEGNFVTGSSFDPMQSGLGQFTVEYVYNNGANCISRDSKVITVRPALTVDAGASLSICQSGSPVDLRSRASVQGGRFSGTGIAQDGYTFNPSGLPAGQYPIRYDVQDQYGCSASDVFTVTVNPSETAYAGQSLSLCKTAAPLDLRDGALFGSSYSFTGIGVTGDYFDPSKVAPDTYTVTLSTTSAYGCVSTSTRSVTVNPQESLNMGSATIVCLNSGTVDLEENNPFPGGVWTSPYVNGSVFDPAASGKGTFNIRYELDRGNGCIAIGTKSVTVRDALTVDAGPAVQVCSNGAALNLMATASKTGGIWQGEGVTPQGVFNPSGLAANTYVLTYTYADSYCSTSDTRTVTILPAPPVFVGAPITVCRTSPDIDLMEGVATLGGYWHGNGVQADNMFNPRLFVAGTYTVNYTVNSANGCSVTVPKQITITNPPTIDAGQNLTVCSGSEDIFLEIGASVPGGTFTGPYVQGNKFLVSEAPVNTYTVTYTYSNNGCTSVDTKTVTVRQPKEVSIGGDLTLCKNSAPYNLVLDVSQTGGTFSGSLGLQNGTFFNPSLVSEGDHLIEYAYTNEFGCVTRVQRKIKVQPVPELFVGADLTVCNTAQPIPLNTSVNYPGGIWSGNFVENGNSFNAARAIQGEFVLTYTYRTELGCTVTKNRKVTVTPPPVVNAGTNLTVCIDDAVIDLTQTVNVQNSQWSGTGVESNRFNAAVAGLGSHQLTMTITNGECISRATKFINVVPLPEVTAGADVFICESGDNVNLNQGVTSGGTWSGSTAVSAQGVFNPRQAKAGTHTLYFTYQDVNGCEAVDTKTVTVYPLLAVNGGSEIVLCSTQPAISLSGTSYPLGGNFSGVGVKDNMFDPSIGVGVYNLTYTVISENGCISSATKTVRVTAPPVIEVGENVIVCSDVESLDLDSEVSVNGGTWEGVAVEGNRFYPAQAGPGVYQMDYVYTSPSNCVSRASKLITVRDKGNVDAGAPIRACRGSATINLLTGVSRAGGVFSGPYVSGNNFNPSTTGVHEVIYTLTDEYGCTVSDTRTVTVVATPELNLGSALSLCSTVEPKNLLLGTFPSYGRYSGQGMVNDSIFDPAVAGIGTHTLVYSLVTPEGCEVSKSRTVTVTAPPVVSLGENRVVCISALEVDLSPYASIKGGVFTGAGVNGNNTFIPSEAGIGTHTVSYELNNNGCISQASFLITVRGLPTVDAGGDRSVCASETSFDLMEGLSNRSGTWSGSNVTNEGIFNASAAGSGEHVLRYTVSDAFACSSTAEIRVLVNPLTDLLIGNSISVCSTADTLDLMEAVQSPLEGVWSGYGVMDGRYIVPSVLGQGQYPVTYGYVDPETGCVSTKQKTVSITPPGNVEAGENIVLCSDSNPYNLQTGITAGGNWSGNPAINGTYFDPSVSGTGNFTVKYTIELSPGCWATDTRIVTVRETEPVDMGGSLLVCTGSGSYDLNSGLSLPGGTWTGARVSSNGLFNSDNADVGTYVAVYQVSNEYGCSYSLEKEITVLGLPTVNAGSDLVSCFEASTLRLNTVDIFPKGGYFTGLGVVSDSLFDMKAVGPGTYSVTYHYNDGGCTGTDSRNIIVRQPPNLDLGADLSLCINSNSVNLSDGVNIKNGRWEGNGITGSSFNPRLAGIGQHRVTYSVISQEGCTVTADKIITVSQVPELDMGGVLQICSNGVSVNLNDFVNLTGGLYSGEGVQSNFFNPTGLAPGNYTVSYVIDDYLGCTVNGSKSIVVVAPDSINIGPDLEICIEANLIDLRTTTSLKGGRYFGSAGIVSGDRFDPSQAGLGLHVVSYEYENAYGCISRDDRVIEVVENSSVYAGEDISLCEGYGTYSLQGSGSPLGGVWSGPGINGSLFDARNVGIGEFKAVYTYDFRNGCIGSDTLVINVSESQISDFGRDSIVCINSNEIRLNFSEALNGGTWSGTAIVDGFFYPSLAGEGVHELQYSNNNLACEIAGKRTFTVVGLPSPATSSQTNVDGCIGEFVTLTAQLPENGLENDLIVAWFKEGSSEPFDYGTEISYEIQGNEQVNYRTQNRFGCYSVENTFVRIISKGPSADIAVDKNVLNFGESTRFYATDINNVQSYKWDFGDGSVSYNKTPWHYYYHSDTFDVKLTVVSSAGCSTTIVKEDYIIVKVEPGRDLDGDGFVDDIILGTPSELDSVGGSKLYPNPAFDHTFAEIVTYHTGNATIELHDMVGNLVESFEVELVHGKNQILIPLEDKKYRKGMYLVSILTNGYIRQHKLIID